MTGAKGTFVKAHIIPKAFLQRATDAPFLEWPSEAGRPKKSFDGWYDGRILTKEGEKILESLDDIAVKVFRKAKLTYRERRDPLDINKLRGGIAPAQIYEVTDVDPNQLRLFGLSILWRAAVSALPAFSLVRLSPAHELDIRKRILAKDAGPYFEYPVYFGVFCDARELTKIAPYRPRNYPFYRFFLDGIVCYVSPTRRVRTAPKYGLLLVGSEPDRIKLLSFSSDQSAHAECQEAGSQEMFQTFGDVFSGFAKSASRRR